MFGLEFSACFSWGHVYCTVQYCRQVLRLKDSFGWIERYAVRNAIFRDSCDVLCSVREACLLSHPTFTWSDPIAVVECTSIQNSIVKYTVHWLIYLTVFSCLIFDLYSMLPNRILEPVHSYFFCTALFMIHEQFFVTSRTSLLFGRAPFRRERSTTAAKLMFGAAESSSSRFLWCAHTHSVHCIRWILGMNS